MNTDIDKLTEEMKGFSWEDEKVDSDMAKCIVWAFINGYSSIEAENCQGNMLCVNPPCCFISED